MMSLQRNASSQMTWQRLGKFAGPIRSVWSFLQLFQRHFRIAA